VSLQFAAQILRFIAISILAADKPQHPLTAAVTVLIEKLPGNTANSVMTRSSQSEKECKRCEQ
jgi:hypothetical protein